MRAFILFLILSGTAAAQFANATLPSADDVVARLMEHDRQREEAFRGYRATRRYVLSNARHHKRAEMLVRISCLEDGSKHFETVSDDGWGLARSHVFPKLLESENEASQPGVRDRSSITPANYAFSIAGKDSINHRAAWVLDVAPKTKNKYLIKGRIWVDAEDYAIVRIEGAPAKNPSFWIKAVHFVHTYQKVGPLWLPASDHSETDARIVGNTELAIDYFDYKSGGELVSTSHDATQRSLP